MFCNRLILSSTRSQIETETLEKNAMEVACILWFYFFIRIHKHQHYDRVSSRVGLHVLLLSCPFSFHVQHVRKYQITSWSAPCNGVTGWAPTFQFPIPSYSVISIDTAILSSTRQTSIFVFSTHKASPCRGNASYICLLWFLLVTHADSMVVLLQAPGESFYHVV